MMNIQKAVIARAKMCETDLDRGTSILMVNLIIYIPNVKIRYRTNNVNYYITI